MIKDNTKVNILGTEYVIEFKEGSRCVDIEADGICDYSDKRIIIEDWKVDKSTLQDDNSYKKKTLIHEIIHAFIYESGLNTECYWARNEEMVDFFAIQLPKLVKTLKELKILE